MIGQTVKTELDDLDFQILRTLEEDARQSCREIAEKLGVATGTVYNRIKKLTDEGVIKGYIPIIDPEKVGYELTALILIQVEGRYLVDVENEVAKFDEVYYVYDITGEFDVAIAARFKTRERLNKFIKSILTIQHVKRTVTNIVLNVVKEDLRVKV
ncbi:Lrp/AsnC family transcriptional regulator [Candidatus Bathyarchaeota archaeon]|nr:Lrp/AsnC family transcriptional regulator [Candidatus Bathyarchaeota archaeon]